MGTWIVGIVLVLLVLAIIRYLTIQKRSGKSIQCGCDCSTCQGCSKM